MAGIVVCDRLLPWRRKAVDRKYSGALAQALSDRDSWIERKALFEGQQAKRKLFIESDIYTSTAAMEQFLAEHLQAIGWLRETHVNFQIEKGGAVIVADVDLPEIESMPRATMIASPRAYRMLTRPLPEKRIRDIYAQHIHSIGFRIIGETFAALPNCNEVVLSGYSQRVDGGTGHVRNDYLYSVRVSRPQWETIDFHALQQVDPVEALGRFDIRRAMTAENLFSPIVPLR